MRLVVVCALLLATAAAACGGGGTATYRIDIEFSISATEDELLEPGRIIRTYDDDALGITLPFGVPPRNFFELETDTPDFCRKFETELEAKSYIDNVSCEEE